MTAYEICGITCFTAKKYIIEAITGKKKSYLPFLIFFIMISFTVLTTIPHTRNHPPHDGFGSIDFHVQRKRKVKINKKIVKNLREISVNDI